MPHSWPETPDIENIRDVVPNVTVAEGDAVVIDEKGKVRPYEGDGRDLYRAPRLVAAVNPAPYDAHQRAVLEPRTPRDTVGNRRADNGADGDSSVPEETTDDEDSKTG